MNTTFNFNRFLKVMCNEWRLTWKKVALFWAIGALFPLAAALGVLVGSSLIDRDTNVALPLALVVLLQGYYLQFYFREFSSKQKTQALLLLPASQNEKFWAKFLLGAVLYLLVSFALISVTLTLTGIRNEMVWVSGLSEVYTEDYFLNYQNITFLASGLLDIVGFLTLWLLIVSFFLFGLSFFKKNALLKTFVLWIVVAAVYQSAVRTVGLPANLQAFLDACFGVALIAISRVMFNEKTI